MDQRAFLRACRQALGGRGEEDAAFLLRHRLLHPARGRGFAPWQVIQVAEAQRAAQGAIPNLAVLRTALTKPAPAYWRHVRRVIKGWVEAVARDFRPVEDLERALDRPPPPLKDYAVAAFVFHLRKEGREEAASWYANEAKKAATLDDLLAKERERRFAPPSAGGPPFLRTFLAEAEADPARRRLFTAQKLHKALRDAGLTTEALLVCWHTLADTGGHSKYPPKVEDQITTWRRRIERVLWSTDQRAMRRALGGSRAPDQWRRAPGEEVMRCAACGELMTHDERQRAAPLQAKSPRDPFLGYGNRRVHFECYVVRKDALYQRLLMRQRRKGRREGRRRERR